MILIWSKVISKEVIKKLDKWNWGLVIEYNNKEYN